MVTMGRAVAQVAAVFMARAAGQILISKIPRATKVDITNNLARAVSNSSKVDTRAMQSSWTVGNIMCLPPVYVNETRSFIRGL